MQCRITNLKESDQVAKLNLANSLITANLKPINKTTTNNNNTTTSCTTNTTTTSNTTTGSCTLTKATGTTAATATATSTTTTSTATSDSGGVVPEVSLCNNFIPYLVSGSLFDHIILPYFFTCPPVQYC